MAFVVAQQQTGDIGQSDHLFCLRSRGC